MSSVVVVASSSVKSSASARASPSVTPIGVLQGQNPLVYSRRIHGSYSDASMLPEYKLGRLI